MADFLPPAVQKFIADVNEYVDPVEKAKKETDKFAVQVEKAGIAADKAMGKAAEAARKAEIAQKGAAEAADKMAKGEIKVEDAAKIAAHAVDQLARANLLEREAALSAADAADKETEQLKQLARQAAITSTVESVSAVRATGNINDHKKAIKEATDAFPELAKSGNSAFREIKKYSDDAARATGKFGFVLNSSVFKKIASTGEKVFGDLSKEAENAFSNVSGSAVGMGALVVAAIGALPEAAGVAAGAITGVLGLALGGIGLYATKGGATAKAAIKDMKLGILQDAKSLVAPFNKVWVTIASDATGAFQDLYPELHTLFADIADVTSNWVDDIAGSLYTLKPAFESIDKASQALEGSLGQQMPVIIGNLGKSIQILTNIVTRDPETFTHLAVSLSEFLVWVAKGIDLLDKFGEIFSLAFAEFGKGMPLIQMFGGVLGGVFGKTLDLNTATGGSVKAFQSQADAIVNAQKQNAKAQTTFHGLATAEQVSKIATDQLKQAFDRLTGANVSAVQAESNVQQAIDDTTIALKNNGKTLDLTKQKGRDNMAQLIADTHAYQDKLIAMKNDGATSAQIAAEADYLRRVFIAQATAMTGNAKTARQLADRLLGIAAASKKIPRTVRQDIYQVMHLTPTQSYLNKRKNILGYAGGGPVKGYADGGPTTGGSVKGPGSGTSDSILALLSNGEFVVNAKQAEKHATLLDAINKGLDGFASGGSAKKKPAMAHFTGDKTREWAASHAAAAVLRSMRKSAFSSWAMGGISRGPDVVEQHTHVSLYVGGSIRSDRDIEAMIQAIILQRNLRNPTSGTNLPAGRVGSSGGF